MSAGDMSPSARPRALPDGSSSNNVVPPESAVVVVVTTTTSATTAISETLKDGKASFRRS